MQLFKTLAFPFLLVSLCLPSVEALAQRNYAVGITAGAALPTGNFSDSYAKGAAITGFLATGMGELPIGLRFDGMYQTFPGRLVTPPGGTADIQTPDLRLWGFGVNFVVTASGTTAKPYLIIGTALNNVRVDSVSAKARNHLGFSGGVGSTFNLGPFSSIVEARFHSISRRPAHGGSIHFVPLLLGMVF